jgi:hypothetical protein
MMAPNEWDVCETFSVNGNEAVRHAISDRDGVIYEFSMHDPTIQSMVPQSQWLAAMSAPVTNAKIDRIERGFTVLIGMGKPADPLGNLLFIRVKTNPGFAAHRLAKMIAMVLVILDRFGIRPDKQMIDKIRGN